jgi:small subunit ribosomal protein S15
LIKSIYKYFAELKDIPNFAGLKKGLKVSQLHNKSTMNLAPEVKKNLFKEHGKSEFDSGSTEAQVAMFTLKIQHLTEHLKINKKDMVTERSLVIMVGKRRKLLDYLKGKDILRYRNLIKKLGIRK